MTRLPLSPLTLDAIQAAAIRTSLLHPDLDLDVRTLLVQLAEVAKTTDPLLDWRTGSLDPLVGGLLDLAALALLWVEQLEDPAAVHAAKVAARAATDAAVSAAPVPMCAWWALCTNLATGTMSHPTLGQVPICDRCRAKVHRIGGGR